MRCGSAVLYDMPGSWVAGSRNAAVRMIFLPETAYRAQEMYPDENDRRLGAIQHTGWVFFIISSHDESA